MKKGSSQCVSWCRHWGWVRDGPRHPTKALSFGQRELIRAFQAYVTFLPSDVSVYGIDWRKKQLRKREWFAIKALKCDRIQGRGQVNDLRI